MNVSLTDQQFLRAGDSFRGECLLHELQLRLRPHLHHGHDLRKPHHLETDQKVLRPHTHQILVARVSTTVQNLVLFGLTVRCLLEGFFYEIRFIMSYLSLHDKLCGCNHHLIVLLSLDHIFKLLNLPQAHQLFLHSHFICKQNQDVLYKT